MMRIKVDIIFECRAVKLLIEMESEGCYCDEKNRRKGTGIG